MKCSQKREAVYLSRAFARVKFVPVASLCRLSPFGLSDGSSQ